MINHARTLLMNINGATQFEAELGEEIIASEYRAKPLPQSIASVRRILFGPTPDKAMLNYRCRQLLSLIHLTELEEYVVALDPRITYDFEDSLLFGNSTYNPTYIQFAGPDTALSVLGTTGSPDTTGRMKCQWDIQIISPGVVDVTWLRPRQSQIIPYTVTDGLSSRIPLQGSGLSVMTRDIVGLQYRVTSYARPTFSLGDLSATIETLGSDTIANLFLVGTPAGSLEPFLTFRNLWETRLELSYKLGGLLMAIIYHTDLL